MPHSIAFLLSLFAALAPVVALAQRHVDVDTPEELDEGTLASIVEGQSGAFERCAAQIRSRTQSYLAEVDVRVRPGAAPASMYTAAIAVDVRSRPSSPLLDQCVRRAVRDAVRHQPYVVVRAVSAQRVFRLRDRLEPPPEPLVPYTEHEVHATVSRIQSALQQCVRLAGIPEDVALRITVRPDGRLVLTSADLPPGASGDALSCLAQRIGQLRVRGRPGRAVSVVHRLGVQSRAW